MPVEPLPRDPAPVRWLAALKALCEQVVTDDGDPVQVIIGGTHTLEYQVLMLGDLTGEQSWAHIGNRGRDEEQSQELFVLVGQPGDDGSTAAARAWRLLARLSHLIRDPDNVAMAAEHGVLWNEITTTRGYPTVETDGHGYVIQAAVRFRARI